MTTFEGIAAQLEALAIEVPSWAYGNSGTRFKVFGQPGVPRDPYEKLADAAQVHRFTGLAGSVSLHIPWDQVDDFGDLAARRRPGRAHRDDQQQHLPGRRLQAGQPAPRRPRGTAEGDRPHARLRRRDGGDRLA